MREIISLDGRWKFHRGDIKVPRPVDKGAVYIQSKNERKHIGPASYYYFDRPDCYYAEREMHNEGWEYVSVPNDFIVDQELDKTQNKAHGFLKYTNAWYRKNFELSGDFINKRILLQFDGIATHSEIYLNGSLMKRNFSAYNSFEIDITNNVYFDRENVIAVYVSTDEYEGWWYQGGGIYRSVNLVITDMVAIDRYGVYAPYKKINNNDWQINYETTLINDDYDMHTLDIKSEVVDLNGVVVSESNCVAVIPKRTKKTFCYSAVVYNPLLWDDVNPNLYTVKTTLFRDGIAIDENVIRIGFRTVEIGPDKGFLINGKKKFINGVNGHADFFATGIVLPANIAHYKIELLKQMGANGYRTSHYQQSVDTMDALDELGFYVINETRWFETTEESFLYLNELVMRDRNRPSVIFWSTGNEERTHHTEQGRRVHRAMTDYIRKLDNTRLITTCEDKKPVESTVFGDCDVIAINYNLNVYDTVHNQYPDKAVIAGECCATGTVRDWHLPSNNNGRVKDKDVITNEWYQAREITWKHFMERSYVVGAYQWIGIDHRGETEWPRISSISGAIDFFLQKKGAFYQNKSYWTKEPMAHIVQHWNFRGLEGKKIPVVVYTNCDEVELCLNGISLGKKTVEKYGYGEWEVEYESGVLVANAYIKGKKVCEDIVKTTGKPVALKLRLENSYKANGKDIALFTCECVDENGLIVPDADEYVYFSTNKDAAIVGTGSDCSDHNRVGNSERKMYAGKISVAVKPKYDAKNWQLFAYSKNCGMVCWESETDE